MPNADKYLHFLFCILQDTRLEDIESLLIFTSRC